MDWFQIFTSGGTAAALALAISAYLKTRPAMITAEAQSVVAKKEMALKSEVLLWQRLAELEKRLEAERASCDERIERVEQRHASDMTDMKGEVMLLRHERVNTRQALAGLFALIKQRGDGDMADIVDAVEQMLASGDRTIAVEKAALVSGRGKSV